MHVRIPPAAKAAAKAVGAAAVLPGASGLELAPNVNTTLLAIERDVEFLTFEVGVVLILLGLILAGLVRIFMSRPTTSAVSPESPPSSACAFMTLRTSKHKGGFVRQGRQ